MCYPNPSVPLFWWKLIWIHANDICSFVIPCEGAMQESIRFPRCKHHQAYLELIFGFWLKVTLCRFMCDKNRIKTGTCHFNHDISGSNSAFDFLTFMHNAAQEKKWNKIKNRVNQLSMYVSTKIRCIALRYRFFLFNNNHKAQANDVVCLRHFIYVNYFRTNKMVFRFVDLFTCSRQNIDMLVCCACAIRWMEQKTAMDVTPKYQCKIFTWYGAFCLQKVL